MTEEKVVIEGYLCEAGNIDMGLKRGNSRAIGIVIEVPASPDLEIRGLTKNTAAMLAKRMRGRFRVTIEPCEETSDETRAATSRGARSTEDAGRPESSGKASVECGNPNPGGGYCPDCGHVHASVEWPAESAKPEKSIKKAVEPCWYTFKISPPENLCLMCGWPTKDHPGFALNGTGDV